MFDYLKKDKIKFGPVKSKGSSILDDDKYISPRDRLTQEESDKKGVNYIRKDFPKNTVYALSTALVSALFTFMSIYGNLLLQGNPDLRISALAFSAILFSLLSIWYAINDLFERDVRHILTYLSLLIAGIQLILWIAIIFIGGR